MTARKVLGEQVGDAQRSGAARRSGGTETTDEEIKAQLETDQRAIRRDVITGMIVNGLTVAVATVMRGDPSIESITVRSLPEFP